MYNWNNNNGNFNNFGNGMNGQFGQQIQQLQNNQMNYNQYPQIQQMQPVNPTLPQFVPYTDANEELYRRVLIGILKHGLTTNDEQRISATRGYICTMRGSQRPDGSRFGLTFNLGHNVQFRNLDPYVYNMSEASLQNGGYGDVIDEKFMSSATWLTPQISAMRDNWGDVKYDSTGRVINGQIISNYMDAIDKYLDSISNFISPMIQIDRMGNVTQTPQLQKALMLKYSFGGINVTPSVVKVINPNNTVSVVVSFLYSLSEEVTLDLKRDITYMYTDR